MLSPKLKVQRPGIHSIRIPCYVLCFICLFVGARCTQAMPRHKQSRGVAIRSRHKNTIRVESPETFVTRHNQVRIPRCLMSRHASLPGATDNEACLCAYSRIWYHQLWVGTIIDQSTIREFTQASGLRFDRDDR